MDRIGAHELDAAPGNDIVPEPICPQIGQQFEHRLGNQVGVRPLETRMFCHGQPVSNHLCECVGGHAGMRCHDQFQ